MFEELDRVDLAGMSDDTLISAVTAATRSEAAAAARRLALVAEVTARQCDDEDDICAHQLIDGWAYAKAQVGAACNLSPWAASKQMRIAQALRDRLPRTAGMFAKGLVSAAVVDSITWRTRLVTDADALALIDAGIAGSATEFGTLSEKGLIEAVDYWVHKFDPCAVIRSQTAARDRCIEFGDRDDADGVVSFWGRMRVTDAQISDTRLDELADGVCDNDPRTKRERRADAVAAVLAGAQRLTCLCGNPDCAGSGKDPRAGGVTIYVFPEQAPDTGHGAPPVPDPQPAAPSPAPTGPTPVSPATDSTSSHEQPAAESGAPDQPTPAAPAARFGSGAGISLDGAIIPARLLAELAAGGATVRTLAHAGNLGTEPRYRPSAKLAAFVRMRSMTCCFPGCGRPAHKTDLDHVTPWPAGATHPGNLRPLCREHHLLKTMRSGWTPSAHADGSTTWTAPTGHRYTTTPGAAILFPHFNIDTPVPRVRRISLIGDPAGRGSAIPRRHRTRAQTREQRVNAERTRNAAELSLQLMREQIAREDSARTEKAGMAKPGGAQGRAAGYFDTGPTFPGVDPFTDADPPPF